MADTTTDASSPATAPRVEPLWRIGDVSAYLGVPIATLYQWRHLGTGPKAYRLGKHLRYRQADVEAWLTEQAS